MEAQTTQQDKKESIICGTLEISIKAGRELAIGDIISSDPYCVVNVSLGHKQNFVYTHKTKVINENLNPDWEETFSVPFYKVNDDVVLHFSVWDKDQCSKDDFLGQYTEILTPSQFVTGERFDKDIASNLQSRKKKSDVDVKGHITYHLKYLPGVFKGHNSFKYHNHKFTGLARTVAAGEQARIYGTYRVGLFHVEEVFGEHWQPWNKNYDAAKKIFGSPLLMSTITTQHNHLYSEISVTKKGILKNGADLLALLKNGYAGGRPRFYTYVIKNDYWYFSETGASFFVDFTSKHAMHACVSDVVRYAGEFHFHKNPNGSFRLVIDNNSGTYAPNKEQLVNLKLLMELNFPGLEVEVVDYHEDKLKQYKEELSKEVQ